MDDENQQKGGDASERRVPDWHLSSPTAIKHTVGGSDINILASGDEAKITRLFEEKRADRAEDLSTGGPC